MQAAIDTGFATAKQSGVSRYIKAVVLGHNPPSIFDKEVIIKLCHLHAHLGKVGGLFKHAIAQEKAGEEFNVYVSEILKTKNEIEDLISDIRDGNFNK